MSEGKRPLSPSGGSSQCPATGDVGGSSQSPATLHLPIVKKIMFIVTEPSNQHIDEVMSKTSHKAILLVLNKLTRILKPPISWELDFIHINPKKGRTLPESKVYQKPADFSDRADKATKLPLIEHIVHWMDIPKVPCRAWIRRGAKPEDIICEEAVAKNPDFLVVNGQIMNLLDKVVQTNLSKHCLAYVKLPVLVVPFEENDGKGVDLGSIWDDNDMTNKTKILIEVRDVEPGSKNSSTSGLSQVISMTSETICRWVLRNFVPQGKEAEFEFIFVNVQDKLGKLVGRMTFVKPEDFNSITTIEESNGIKLLYNLYQWSTKTQVAYQGYISEGLRHVEICATVDLVKPDLLVLEGDDIGSKCLSLPTGNVAEYCVEHAQCPVLVLPSIAEHGEPDKKKKKVSSP